MLFAIQHEGVYLNPILQPPPQKWWIDSFEYFVVFPLLPKKRHGPFYRIGGDLFDPCIGIPSQQYSERQCFYGLTLPHNAKDARSMYHLPAENPCLYAFEFTLVCPEDIHNAELYIGSVRDGSTLQVGINSVVKDLIQREIDNDRVLRHTIPGAQTEEL